MKDKSKKKSLKTKETKKTMKDTIGSTNDKPVVFSFGNFSDSEYGLDEDPIEFQELISHLKIYSKMIWQATQNAGKHGLGSEEINTSELSQTMPEQYKDVKKVLAFRYGGKKAFIGIRKDQVLDVLFIDPKFTLYDHE